MRTAVITGANRGVGLALTRELLEREWRVIATTRTIPAPALNVLSAQHEERLAVVQLDLTDETAAQRAAREIGRLTTRLDLLVNNAGMFPVGQQLDQIQMGTFMDAYRVNAVAPFLLTRDLLPVLRATAGSRVVNVSSVKGDVNAPPDGRGYAYRASKAALNMLTRTLAFDLREHGVIVVAVHPGWVSTDMGGPNGPVSPDEAAFQLAEFSVNLNERDSGCFFPTLKVQSAVRL